MVLSAVRLTKLSLETTNHDVRVIRRILLFINSAVANDLTANQRPFSVKSWSVSDTIIRAQLR